MGVARCFEDIREEMNQVVTALQVLQDPASRRMLLLRLQRLLSEADGIFNSQNEERIAA